MEKSLGSLSPKSETASAIRYALSRWRALTRYIDEGRLEIDNSAAERALRAVALESEEALWRRKKRFGVEQMIGVLDHGGSTTS
jgi:transposase